jgi:rubrerythrin
MPSAETPLPKEELLSTLDNLKEAFAGESQANRKYLAFAKKAEADGFPQVAKLFRAAAEAETVHAHSHLRVLGWVQGTLENLKAAVAGEAHEFKSMYPDFVKAAEAEENAGAARTFKLAMAVEKTHHDLYNKALSAVEEDKDLPAAPIYVCPVCGHTEVGGAPDPCPVCGASRKKFVEIR